MKIKSKRVWMAGMFHPAVIEIENESIKMTNIRAGSQGSRRA